MDHTPASPVWSRSWLFALAALLFALFMAFVLPGQAEAARRAAPADAAFDTSFFYSPAAAFDRAARYSVEGRFAYIAARWSFDLAFPAVYGFFALCGWAFALERLGRPALGRRRLALIALLGPLFDLAENVAVTVVMASVPARPAAWGLAASIATPVKWVFVLVGLGGALLLPAAVAVRAVRRRTCA